MMLRMIGAICFACKSFGLIDLVSVNILHPHRHHHLHHHHLPSRHRPTHFRGPYAVHYDDGTSGYDLIHSGISSVIDDDDTVSMNHIP